jgi:hypothetical protein
LGADDNFYQGWDCLAGVACSKLYRFTDSAEESGDPEESGLCRLFTGLHHGEKRYNQISVALLIVLGLWFQVILWGLAKRDYGVSYLNYAYPVTAI